MRSLRKAMRAARPMHRVGRRWDSTADTEMVSSIGGPVWGLNFTPENIFTEAFEFDDGLQNLSPLARITDSQGNLLREEFESLMDPETAVKIMQCMTRASVMDTVCYEAQRQGRISFYMTQFGEEGTIAGCGAALSPTDLVYGQYREAAILLYRGYTPEEMLAQCLGSCEDPAKGRQMPIHYGSPKLHWQTISSPLATQIPQAAGAGYTYRLQRKDDIVCCFFGEGAASEGDFHAALNFAATLKSHTLFYCRNNGFAISTPATEQYAGDGIVPRGRSYGIPSIRIDGNDVMAVYHAVTTARKMILETGRPALIEAMTYRGGHHSTSDDSTRYRKKEDIDVWLSSLSPITRFSKFCENRGWWTEDMDKSLRKEVDKEVKAALARQEKLAKYPANAMFDDVYATMPPILKQQQAELNEHLKEYGEHYPQLMEGAR